MTENKLMISTTVSRAHYAEMSAEATRRGITRAEIFAEMLKERYPHVNADETST